MDKLSLFLSFMMFAAMIMLFAPNILMLNQGKILRNVAIWLAIFTGLALVYRNFGPESAHPLFSAPAGTARRAVGEPKNDTADSSKSDDDKTDGSQGYTPPAE